jgi:hypothetical protein
MEYDKIIFPAELMWIGTPNKLSEMFTTAGFNVNRLKMFILMMQILKQKKKSCVFRIVLLEPNVLFFEQFTERIEILAEKMLEEPYELILMEKMKTKKILTRKKTWR